MKDDSNAANRAAFRIIYAVGIWSLIMAKLQPEDAIPLVVLGSLLLITGATFGWE